MINKTKLTNFVNISTRDERPDKSGNRTNIQSINKVKIIRRGD